jgi:hypothetical protein
MEVLLNIERPRIWLPDTIFIYKKKFGGSTRHQMQPKNV